MKEYYRTDLGVLYCGDCFDIIKNIEAGVVNLVITDPPYNIGDSSKLTKIGNKIVSNKEAWGFYEPMDSEKWKKDLEGMRRELNF